jgi:hypothetical protein
VEIDILRKEALVQCKDLASVDTLVNQLSPKKSFFNLLSYHDLLKDRDSEVMTRKKMLNLAKRNNAHLQEVNDKTLERIIQSTKKVK